MYPVDSLEHILFYQDEDDNWHDEGTCKIERIGPYAPVDRSVPHFCSDGKLRNWQGIEVDGWGSVVAT